MCVFDPILNCSPSPLCFPSRSLSSQSEKTGHTTHIVMLCFLLLPHRVPTRRTHDQPARQRDLMVPHQCNALYTHMPQTETEPLFGRRHAFGCGAKDSIVGPVWIEDEAEAHARAARAARPATHTPTMAAGRPELRLRRRGSFLDALCLVALALALPNGTQKVTWHCESQDLSGGAYRTLHGQTWRWVHQLLVSGLPS